MIKNIYEKMYSCMILCEVVSTDDGTLILLTLVPATANAVQLLLSFFPWVAFTPSAFASPTAMFLPSHGA